MTAPRTAGAAERHDDHHPHGRPQHQQERYSTDEPSPLAPYAKLQLTASDQKTTTLGESSVPDKDTTADSSAPPRLRRHDFVRGRWEVELHDYMGHCVPNGWMVCLLPCVTVAQISVRIGVDSYGAALLKQLVFNLVVYALVILELVFCYLYMASIFGDGKVGTATPPLVIFSACLVVTAVSFVWVSALATLRARVRDRFGIAGSASDDKCAMAWCTPCALAQMATQVKSYVPGSCDVRAPDALPPYIP